ncbi:hypothetical protein [Microcoleus sp. N9_A1]|uniref:hypothetical protein n=1 Tax=Microcoleus sp. N9_A1 TaxID=3055380 RepID=UPI002FD0E6E7
MSWFSTLTSVARVAGGILTKIGELGNASDGEAAPLPSFDISNVTYVYSNKSNKLLALNNDPSVPEVNLTYSRTNDDGALVTVIQPLEFGSTYDATKDIQDFDNGNIVISNPESSTQMAEIGNPPRRSLFYTISTLFAAKVFLTKDIFILKTDKGFALQSSTIIDSASITYKDKDGTVVQIDGKARSQSSIDSSSGSGNNGSYITELPFQKGTVTDLPYREVTINITMPTPTYMELTAERRQRLQKISDFPELETFLAARSRS